jgi:FG-GAP repeat
MNNNLVTQVANAPDVAPDWRIAGTGDYNGDGYADILLEQTVNGRRVVWLTQAGV